MFSRCIKCIYKHVNFLFVPYRHGERYPSGTGPPDFLARDWPGFLEEAINPLMEKSTGVSPSVDIKFPWKNLYLDKESWLQAPVGDKQLYRLGRSFAKKFPELLKGRFSIADFKFTSTCKRRASQSATAFSLGYLRGKGHLTKYNLQPTR